MAEGRGNVSQGAGARGSGWPMCPYCRKQYTFASNEQKEELKARGRLTGQCMHCGKPIHVVLTPDRQLQVLPLGSPGSTPPGAAPPAVPPVKGAPGGNSDEVPAEAAEVLGFQTARPAARPPEPKRPPATNGPRAEPSPAPAPPSPPPVEDRRPEALSPVQQLGRAIEEAAATLAAVQGQVTNLQETVRTGLKVNLTPESWQHIQRMGTACTTLGGQFEKIAERAERAAAKVEQALQDGTADSLAEHLLSKLLAPGRLWAGLNAYSEWVLNQRGGEEEGRIEESRRRIIEHLPGLFRILEDALAEWTPAADSPPLTPERQYVLDELRKVDRRVRDWLGSAAGLVFFPSPGEAFDIAQHDLHGTVVTGDPAVAGSIKEVVRTGYRLGSEGPILRRASVICWVKPRDKGTQEPPLADS